MPRSISILSVLLLVFAAIPCAASEWKYRLTGNGAEGVGIYRTFEESGASGIRIVMATNLKSSHTAGVTDTGGMIFWKARGSAGWEYDVERRGNQLFVRSKAGGKWTTNVQNVDAEIWSEYLPFTASKLVGEGKKSFYLWSINPEDGKLWKIRADRMGLTNLSVNGTTNIALAVLFTIPGVPEAIYREKYYFHPSDGTFLYYEKDGLKQELMEEK